MAPAASPFRRFAVAALLAAAVAIALPAAARSSSGTVPDVAYADLPQEARATYRAIPKGGPFPYDRDGVVFGNREGILPAKPRGYYHEYTVPTPGVKSRGARRIVCGGAATAPDACWYSADHYQSFRRIRE
jgi:ribonuclease T1